MCREREWSDLGFYKLKGLKNCFKTRCCVFKPNRLARAKTWSLKRPDTKIHARAKKSSLEPKTRCFRSATQKLARATKCSLERRTRKHTPRSLERRKARSSQETHLSGPKPRHRLLLERPNPGSSEEPKTTARSSDQLLARAKVQNSGQQHLVSNSNQPVTNLPNTSYNSRIGNEKTTTTNI